ncbi:MAG: hypothetical protein LiPW41_129 [Parcubacteria group bacterium LiPW_41]|nr:MAG: hypothetical protein LiPW41_129 [Parcubacteria group bacterium LiPW_41]
MQEVSSPTQKFVEINEIKDGVVYLKNGGIRRVLIVGGINFDLKSEAEQNLILGSFQNFLNTVDYPIQLFIHSRKVNVDAYLDKMRERREKEENELLRIQIDEYINFIKTLVEQNSIISKTFFVVVPYEGGVSNSSPVGIISSLFSSQKSKNAEEKATTQSKLEQLEHRAVEVRAGLEQIGLHVSELDDEELTELFYNLYNPQLIEKKDLQIAKK